MGQTAAKSRLLGSQSDSEIVFAIVVCVKFCKKYFRNIQFLFVAVGPVGMWES